MRKYLFVFVALAILSSLGLNAQQCKIKNDFFEPGEQLSYDLYYRYGLINVKAGSSTLKTSSDRYNGKDALKMELIANSSGAAAAFFTLSDTLTIHTTRELVPLSFVKHAHENDEHINEEVTYTYNGSGVNIRTKKDKNGEQRFDKNLTSQSCVYDLLSVVYYARTLDYASMKKGDQQTVELMSGSNKVKMTIRHRGTENIKANDGKTYSCLVMSLIINEGQKSNFEDKDESMRVFVTNDSNRMPVRLDSKLKIGSTRAMLKSYKGNKHTVTTVK